MLQPSRCELGGGVGGGLFTFFSFARKGKLILQEVL